jgi:peptidyl-prolyl cis-trans isomerase SurA
LHIRILALDPRHSTLDCLARLDLHGEHSYYRALLMKLFSFFVAGVFFCTGLRARAELVNAVNIVVNDSVITYDQIQRTIAPVMETLASRYRGQPQEFEQELMKVRDEAVQALVERKLILSEFKTAGYNLPESFIDDSIQDEIRKNYYGDRARLTKSLQFEGMTYEAFRQQQRERFIVDYMIRQHTDLQKILISPKQIETYYNEHTDKFKVADKIKLRVIVINQPTDSPAGTAKKIADEVLKKLEEGVSFIEMATVYSSGPYRSEGGDRGWIDRSATYHPQLMAAAFSLKPGQRSGIIELPEGCYFLLVEEARPAHVKSLEEARLEIEEEVDRPNQEQVVCSPLLI